MPASVNRRFIQATTFWFVGLLMLCSSGCTGLRLPAIDPSGERIFLPAPNFTTIDDGSSFRGPVWTSPPQAPLQGTPAAGLAAVPYSLNTPTPPLFGPGAPNPYGTLGAPAGNPFANPYATAAPFAAERLTGQTSSDARDGIPGQLRLSSQRLVVPVGEEVILRAAICGSDGYLVTREPIEWSLAPNSVGTIVEVDQQNKSLLHQLFRRPPSKSASDFALGVTSSRPQTVPRGSASPYDDLQLARGETWISLTSATPGVTSVHCRAPSVSGWEQRRASTTIQWVDPNARQPTPAEPGVSVPGATTQPAPTPAQPAAPAEPALPPTRPDVQLKIEGPDTAKADEQLVYRITVTNTGNADANEVEVSSKVPLGVLQYVSSEPVANVFGDRLVWPIGNLQRGQSQEFILRYVAQRGGQVRINGVLDHRGADRVEKFVDTAVRVNPLSVAVLGPETARNGERLPLQIRVTNNSDRELTGLTLLTDFDPKLYHASGLSPIEAPLGAIPANQSRTYPLEFQIRGAGKLCSNVTVKAADGSQATTESCVDVGADAAQFDGPAFGAPTGQAAFSVVKTVPVQMGVGGRGLFKIRITNTGRFPLTRLRIEETFDDSRLEPKRATEGMTRNGNRLTWSIPRLNVGDTALVEIDYEGRATGQAGSRATVTSAEGVTETAERYVNVLQQGAAIEAIPRSPVSTRFVAVEPADAAMPAALPPVAPAAARSRFSAFRPLGSQRIEPHHNAPPTNSTVLQPIATADNATASALPTRMAGNWHVDIRRMGRSQQHNEITYTVRITNRDSRAEENVKLMIETPRGTQFASSINPPMIRQSRRSSDGRTVEFHPVASLRPDETATFQIVVQQSDQPNGGFRAKVSSSRWPKGSVFNE